MTRIKQINSRININKTEHKEILSFNFFEPFSEDLRSCTLHEAPH